MKILVNGTPWYPDRGAINVVGVTVTDDTINLCTTLNFQTQVVQLSPALQQTGNVNVSGSVQSGAGIGLFGTAPPTQQNGTGNTHTVAAGATTAVFTNTTFDGSTGTTAYTVGDIVKALKAYGLLAA